MGTGRTQALQRAGEDIGGIFEDKRKRDMALLEKVMAVAPMLNPQQHQALVNTYGQKMQDYGYDPSLLYQGYREEGRPVYAQRAEDLAERGAEVGIEGAEQTIAQKKETHPLAIEETKVRTEEMRQLRQHQKDLIDLTAQYKEALAIGDRKHAIALQDKISITQTKLTQLREAGATGRTGMQITSQEEQQQAGFMHDVLSGKRKSEIKKEEAEWTREFGKKGIRETPVVAGGLETAPKGLIAGHLRPVDFYQNLLNPVAAGRFAENQWVNELVAKHPITTVGDFQDFVKDRQYYIEQGYSPRAIDEYSRRIMVNNPQLGTFEPQNIDYPQITPTIKALSKGISKIRKGKK